MGLTVNCNYHDFVFRFVRTIDEQEDFRQFLISADSHALVGLAHVFVSVDQLLSLKELCNERAAWFYRRAGGGPNILNPEPIVRSTSTDIEQIAHYMGQLQRDVAVGGVQVVERRIRLARLGEEVARYIGLFEEGDAATRSRILMDLRAQSGTPSGDRANVQTLVNRAVVCKKFNVRYLDQTFGWLWAETNRIFLAAKKYHHLVTAAGSAGILLLAPFKNEPRYDEPPSALIRLKRMLTGCVATNDCRSAPITNSSITSSPSTPNSSRSPEACGRTSGCQRFTPSGRGRIWASGLRRRGQ